MEYSCPKLKFVNKKMVPKYDQSLKFTYSIDLLFRNSRQLFCFKLYVI